MAGTKKDGVRGGSGILASAKNRSAMLQKTLCSAVAAACFRIADRHQACFTHYQKKECCEETSSQQALELKQGPGKWPQSSEPSTGITRDSKSNSTLNRDSDSN